MADDNANYARVKRWREKHRWLVNLRQREYRKKKNLSGGVESRHAVESSSETPEKTERIALAEEAPRSPFSGPSKSLEEGVIATAPQIRKAVSAVKDSGSSAPPAQTSKAETLANLRDLVAQEQEKPATEAPASKPRVFRDDFGNIVTEHQWEIWQEKKRIAKEKEYEIDGNNILH